MQDVASLKSECISHWKIQGEVQINSNPFCIRCGKPWTPSTYVELTTVFQETLKNEEATLLDHLVLSTNPETRCLKIPELQYENVV